MTQFTQYVPVFVSVFVIFVFSFSLFPSFVQYCPGSANSARFAFAIQIGCHSFFSINVNIISNYGTNKWLYCIVHGMFVDEVNCYFTLLTSNYSMPRTTSLTQQVGGMNRRKTSKGSWDSLESQILTLRKMDWSFTEAKTLLTWRIHCQIHQLKKIRWHLQTANSKARSALSTEKKTKIMQDSRWETSTKRLKSH